MSYEACSNGTHKVGGLLEKHWATGEVTLQRWQNDGGERVLVLCRENFFPRIQKSATGTTPEVSLKTVKSILTTLKRRVAALSSILVMAVQYEGQARDPGQGKVVR